jgi:glyoxylase I family protein
VRIVLSSVYVEDQDAARRFYTEVLGFTMREEFPVGEYRWLTVVSPEEPDGVELTLQPNASPISSTYQRALFAAGITATAFGVEDLAAEYERLCDLGVRFTTPPTPMGPVINAVLDDTCGNLINLSQKVN